jgi:CBS-domain-containing membrane protein
MRNIRIEGIYKLHGKASMIIPADAALDYVVALLGHERHIQGMFMVDSNQKYVGMLSRMGLLKWTQFQLFQGNRKTEIDVNELSRLLSARKARDIETRNSSTYFVKESNTLQDALDLMITFGEDIIPVLDDKGHVIGDLFLSEILSKVLEYGIKPQA